MSEIREFLEQKLYAVWIRDNPVLKADAALAHDYCAIVQGSMATVRQYQGMSILQCGRSVGYHYDLRQPGMQAKYEHMVVEAQRGTLQSLDVLAGFLEQHQDSGIEGEQAYLITAARFPGPWEGRDTTA